MDFVVRVTLNLTDPTGEFAVAALRQLVTLDPDAEMAEGTAYQVAYWTTVDASSPEAAVNSGAQRVRESLQGAMGLEASSDWPLDAQPAGIEVYPLHEDPVMVELPPQARVS